MAGSSSLILKQLLEIWGRLNKVQRLTIVTFGTIVFAGLTTFVYFMNRIEYEVLYRDLNLEDAQAIAAKLKEEKKEYIVQGNSILVEGSKTDIDKLRLEIASNGMGRSGKPGYELFDKNQFGMTDFTEQVNLQRALEGELARTINSLTEITHARVHLVLPRDSIFEDKKEEAKASVAVRLKRGSELSKSSIAGIKGLVAGAVPGLQPFNVSVLDEDGKLLAQSLSSGEAGRAEIQAGIREQLEKELVFKVVSILEPVVGKGKVHANASVDLDFNTTEQTEETYNPTPPAIASQQKTEERVGGGARASGVPGSPANAPAGQPANSQERSRQSEVTNYEISKMVRHTVQPKGTVRRLSMAVLLDNKSIQTVGPDGKVSVKGQPISQQELDAYRELVNAAVGYDKERGDTVTLENHAFYTEIIPKDDTGPATWTLFGEYRPRGDAKPEPWYVRYQYLLNPAIKYSSFLILFLLVYVTLFRPMKKRVFQAFEGAAPALAQDVAGQIGAPSDMAARGLPAAEQTEEMASLESATRAAIGAPEHGDEMPELSRLDDQIEADFMKEAQVLDMGARKYSVLKKKLAQRAKTEPELVSQLVRSWMAER